MADFITVSSAEQESLVYVEVKLLDDVFSILNQEPFCPQNTTAVLEGSSGLLVLTFRTKVQFTNFASLSQPEFEDTTITAMPEPEPEDVYNVYLNYASMDELAGLQSVGAIVDIAEFVHNEDGTYNEEYTVLRRAILCYVPGVEPIARVTKQIEEKDKRFYLVVKTPVHLLERNIPPLKAFMTTLGEIKEDV